jgi:predicted  nucleic acid-binding Zn-ribbon protein
MAMNKDTMNKLASQLVDCQDEQKKLRGENERLRTQLTDIERRHKTALDNAHVAGYRAGQQDAQRGIHR